MAQSPEPFALERGEGTSVWFLGTLVTIKATEENTQGSFSLIEELAPPGFGPPWHVHHEDDELFYILEGEETFQVGEQEIRAPEGSTVYAPHGIPHSYKVEGETPARHLCLTFRPGLENFVLEVGTPAEELTLPPDPEPTQEELEKIEDLQEKYGFEILGPPPWDENTEGSI